MHILASSVPNPKSPSTQKIRTWGFSISSCSEGFGKYRIIRYLDP